MTDKISYNNVRRAAKRAGLIAISRAYGKQVHMAEHWKKSDETTVHGSTRTGPL